MLLLVSQTCCGIWIWNTPLILLSGKQQDKVWRKFGLYTLSKYHCIKHHSAIKHTNASAKHDANSQLARLGLNIWKRWWFLTNFTPPYCSSQSLPHPTVLCPKPNSLPSWEGLGPSFPPHHAPSLPPFLWLPPWVIPEFWLLTLMFSYISVGIKLSCSLSCQREWPSVHLPPEQQYQGKNPLRNFYKICLYIRRDVWHPQPSSKHFLWLLFSLFFILILTFCLKWLWFF